MRTTKWCHWYNIQVFDATVTQYWQLRSHKPACHEHISDDWLDDCRKSTRFILYMKWRALGPARSLAGRCRWLVSVLTSHHWHRRSEFSQTTKMKTNPLLTLESQNVDQGQLAVWSGTSSHKVHHNFHKLDTLHATNCSRSVIVQIQMPLCGQEKDCNVQNKWSHTKCVSLQ